MNHITLEEYQLAYESANEFAQREIRLHSEFDQNFTFQNISSGLMLNEVLSTCL